MVLIDSITRLQPGVLGCADSADQDSFSRGMLKHPQYTRPREFQNLEVPEELLTGDHAAIKDWRLTAAVKQTLIKRPELLAAVEFSSAEKKVLARAGLWDEVSRLRSSES
jgi:tRNA (guanine37-N1)-methyltransferase